MKCTICGYYEAAHIDTAVPEQHRENLCKQCYVVANYISANSTYTDYKLECSRNIQSYLVAQKLDKSITKRRNKIYAAYELKQKNMQHQPVCAGCGDGIDLRYGCCDTTEETREALNPDY